MRDFRKTDYFKYFSNISNGRNARPIQRYLFNFECKLSNGEGVQIVLTIVLYCFTFKFIIHVVQNNDKRDIIEM